MHLRLFETARDYFSTLESGYEVVGGILSPVTDAYKKKGLVSAEHRMNMCRLAVESSDWLQVDDWESRHSEFVPTKLVLDHFHEVLNEGRPQGEPPFEVKLLCGADLLGTFAVPDLWAIEHQHKICGVYGIVALDRTGSNAKEIIFNNDILFKYQHNIFLVPQWIVNDVSSTKMRQLAKRGMSLKYLTPDPVVDYIAQHKLWQE
ncbi:Nicotinamide/nicotinic acid mononucleotide adenylyltransferase 3, variant 2 [Balamuthia mandrillaris]